MPVTFAAFVETWAHYRTAPVTAAELDGAETRLGTSLPAAYREALIALGAPSTRASLLASIVDQDIDMADVQDFFSPADLVQFTEEWRPLGLPAHLIAFASDCAGNLFCFAVVKPEDRRPPDAAVWLWNQEFKRARIVSAGFGAWITAFCGIAPTQP